MGIQVRTVARKWDMELSREDNEASRVDPGDDRQARDLHHVQRAQVDPRDFAPLYERYLTSIYTYCLRRLHDPELAADAAATVFLRALAALPKFRPDLRREGSTFRAWLFTIAHNVVVDTFRSKRTMVSIDQHLPSLEATPHFVTQSDLPERTADQAEAEETVRRLLAQLPPKQRSVVELRLAGLSSAEIGQTLGMSASAIKSAQFRAYATLRTLIRTEHGPNTEDAP